MLQSVHTGSRSVEAYRGVAPHHLLDELRTRAEPLRGMRVLHLNATPYGGGVSELLRSFVPLMNDLGIAADWQVISGDTAFFEVTKQIHNALQGAPGTLSQRAQEVYRANSALNAANLDAGYDFVFVHDPQPAAILEAHGKGSARWIWRCHIDTSQPNPSVWRFIREYLRDYDAAIFTMADFLPPDLPIGHVDIIPPAIDPLSPKNFELPGSIARQILDWIGVELGRPLITQVSRFDPWKDPLGVIAAYRLAREEVPGLQLALAGSMALDDPEGWKIYHQITSESASDPLIHVFTNLTGVGNIEVNAFQRISDLIVQKSIREGFGLVVSEALWKRTPVVAGRAGGIPLQMADGAGGALVESVEECAAEIVRLLSSPEEAARAARRGRARVRESFLLPRLLLNEVSLMGELIGAAPRGRARRDPVCGIALGGGEAVASTTYEGEVFAFCSAGCRDRFLKEPLRYTSAAEAPVAGGGRAR